LLAPHGAQNQSPGAAAPPPPIAGGMPPPMPIMGGAPSMVWPKRQLSPRKQRPFWKSWHTSRPPPPPPPPAAGL
jgi:hypothetical protein